MNQKQSQIDTYNKNLLNDLSAGLGVNGFSKIKTLKDLVMYKSFNSLKIRKNDRVLDVGCNAGETLNRLAKEFGIRGFGIDISDKTIDIAQKHNTFNNQYTVGSADKLPYEDNYFDVVISQDVLEHLENPEDALSEMARVLKPKGKLFIYCISVNNRGTVRQLMQIFHHKHAWGDLGDHKQEYLIDEMILKANHALHLRISYFHSFFSLIIDEFILRPLLFMFSKSKPQNSYASISTETPKTKRHNKLANFLKITYRGMLEIIFYTSFILDIPWKLAKKSDALLIYGTKK